MADSSAPSARYRVAPDLVMREIAAENSGENGGGLLLVNLQSGATWRLDPIGAAIARKLDGSTDVATIVRELDQRYGVGVERLERDVAALLSDLQRNGLVEPVAAP